MNQTTSQPLDSKVWGNIGAVVLLIVVLIVFAQYGSKKIAFALSGLIVLSALMFNIESLKGVFKSA